jgi:hypothetical protein
MNDNAGLLSGAQRIHERERLAFLPRVFGENCMTFERLVFNHASLLQGYKGGQWDFYELSSGGALLVAGAGCGFSGDVPVAVAGNDYEGVLPAPVAGLIVCLFALGSLSSIAYSRGNDALMELAAEQSGKLLDFAAVSMAGFYGEVRRAID